MNTFTSFDGVQIAYHDEGEGPAVILLHGFGVDGLGQFGEFERIVPLLEKRRRMFLEVFGGDLPFPNPPLEGRPGVARALLAAGARTVLPDMRGFGASDKPRDKSAYAGSAMARDVMALIDQPRYCGCHRLLHGGRQSSPATHAAPAPGEVRHSRGCWGLGHSRKPL